MIEKSVVLEETEGYTVNYSAVSYSIYQTVTYAHEGVGKSMGYDYSRLQKSDKGTSKIFLLRLYDKIDIN